MQKREKIACGILVALVLLVGIGFLVKKNTQTVSLGNDGYSHLANTAPKNDAKPLESLNFVESQHISFSYPRGWHIFSNEIYDNPNNTVPDINIYVDSAPIKAVSPSDGGSPASKITLRSYAPGDAILAPYEHSDWNVVSDTVTIRGVEATRLRLTAKPDADFISGYAEVIFVHNDKIGFEVTYTYSNANEASNEGWEMIKNSLKVEDNPVYTRNGFNPSKHRVGDTYRGMKITEIKQYGDASMGVNGNYIAQFSGKATVTGTYTYEMNEFFGVEMACMTVSSPEEKQKLPYAGPDQSDIHFCFKNLDLVKKFLTNEYGSGIATVVIDNLQLVRIPTEGYDTATLVQVVSKK